MAALSWSQWNVGLLRVVWDTLTQRFAVRHVTARLTLPLFPDLTVMITGATSGIGLHTARALALAGAHVVLAVRNINAAKDLICQWNPETPRPCIARCGGAGAKFTAEGYAFRVMFSNLLQCRLPKEAGIGIICVHPGEVTTQVARNLPKIIQKAYLRLFILFSSDGGARSVLFCATDDKQVQDHACRLRGFGYPLAPYYGPDHLKIWSVGKHALDMERAPLLWEETLKLVGLPANCIEATFTDSIQT